MDFFSIVKRGYNPQEVDEYIVNLEQIIKSYKDKENAISNALISAQVAADSLLRNSQPEEAEYRTKLLSQLHNIYDSLKLQLSNVRAFQDEHGKFTVNPAFNQFCDTMMESQQKAIEDIGLILSRADAGISVTKQS